MIAVVYVVIVYTNMNDLFSFMRLIFIIAFIIELAYPIKIFRQCYLVHEGQMPITNLQ